MTHWCAFDERFFLGSTSIKLSEEYISHQVLESNRADVISSIRAFSYDEKSKCVAVRNAPLRRSEYDVAVT